MSKSGTILVVDDDDDILTAARLLLRRRFAEVVTCRRPERIPDLMQRHAFDVVLASQLGVGAFRALAERGLNGVMISVVGQLQLHYVPFTDLIDAESLVTVVRLIDTGSDPVAAIAERYASRAICPAKHAGITSRGDELVLTTYGRSSGFCFGVPI